MRKTVFLDTYHTDAIGGGENYLMRFAMELNKHADVYVRYNWDPTFKECNGFYELFPIFEGKFKPDIHIQCNYNNIYPLIGGKNILITFFPNKSLKPDEKFDDIVTICEYSQKYVDMYWQRLATIIYPCIDINLYYSTIKRNQIVSLGHFFQEPDGHSKNQHILIEAFKPFSDYELVLIGNVHKPDVGYVDKLKRLSDNLNVTFMFNAPHERIINILAESKFLWHANGYNRTNPAQTEHFGIIALEALASKCVPIVHNSGGCKDIEGVWTWNNILELVGITQNITEIKQMPIPKQYTLSCFNNEVQKWISKF